MSKLYNQKPQTRKRQALRKNMSSPEQVLWQQLRQKQIQGIKFRRQYSVGSYVVDFYAAKPRLASEVDGDSHFRGGQPEYDRQRQQYIESCGIKFLRFTNVDVQRNLPGVLEEISKAL